MPRFASKLAPTSKGGFVARKVIPLDVRDEYAKLYEQRTEERLNTGPMPAVLARAKYREWSSEIEAADSPTSEPRAKGRGARSPQRKREHWPASGTSGSPRGRRRAIGRRTYGRTTRRMCALSFMVQRWPAVCSLATRWNFGSAIAECATACARSSPMKPSPSNSWRQSGGSWMLRRWTMFLDYVTRDFFKALALLARRARGDYGPDKWTEQFPRSEGTVDPSLTPWSLFERWIATAKPAVSTVDRWRAVFLRLQSDFPNTNAAALLPEQMQHWANGLINSDRTAGTVAEVWVNAARTCVRVGSW